MRNRKFPCCGLMKEQSSLRKPMKLEGQRRSRLNNSQVKSSADTIKPPNSDHIGSELFGHCSEVGLISEVVFQIQYNV